MKTNVTPSIFELSPHELTERLAPLGGPAFRARQILAWVHGRLEADPHAMSDLPAAVRSALPDLVSFHVPEVVARQVSADGQTEKFALTLAPDEPPVETVLMVNRRRRPSFCVSSQLGCGMGCRFCRTAGLGLRRNLTAGELVVQIWLLRRRLVELNLPPESHSVVFMGMGEPLANQAALDRALHAISAPWGLKLSPRHLAVSTAGVVEGVAWMAREHPQVNLALSLNAADDVLRLRLMPMTPPGGVRVLVDAMHAHFLATHRLPTFEYVLIGGINDGVVHARALARLLGARPGLVNLIPYNPGEDDEFRPTTPGQARAFLETLTAAGLRATLRRSTGREIQAACGQLAGELPLVRPTSP